MTHDVLSSYVRAWSRHQILLALPSQDAAACSGLSLPQAARLFDAACIEISPFLPRTPGAGAPDDCPVDLIVEDDALTYRFPHRYPDPARRGEVNDDFLNPSALADRLLPVLETLKERVRLVVLRPAPLYRSESLRLSALLERHPLKYGTIDLLCYIFAGGQSEREKNHCPGPTKTEGHQFFQHVKDPGPVLRYFPTENCVLLYAPGARAPSRRTPGGPANYKKALSVKGN